MTAGAPMQWGAPCPFSTDLGNDRARAGNEPAAQESSDAHLVAAAASRGGAARCFAQVGAMPTCFLSGNVDGQAGVVTVSAWEGDVTGPTIASATAAIG